MLWYFCARFSHRFALQGCRRDLKLIGHDCCSRWLDEHESDENPKTAWRDLHDVEISDGVILFAEEPRNVPTRGGRLVEYGYGLAYGKRAIVLNHVENIFCHLGEFYPDWQTFLKTLSPNLRNVWPP